MPAAGGERVERGRTPVDGRGRRLHLEDGRDRLRPREAVAARVRDARERRGDPERRGERRAVHPGGEGGSAGGGTVVAGGAAVPPPGRAERGERGRGENRRACRSGGGGDGRGGGRGEPLPHARRE